MRRAPPVRFAERLGGLYRGLGLGLLCFVVISLAFPLTAGAAWIPPAFIPTLGELITFDDWRVFVPHALYLLYGTLLVTLGSSLIARARTERLPDVFGTEGDDLEAESFEH